MRYGPYAPRRQAAPFVRDERTPLLALLAAPDRLVIVPGAAMGKYALTCLTSSATGMGFVWTGKLWSKPLDAQAVEEAAAVLSGGIVKVQTSDGIREYRKSR